MDRLPLALLRDFQMDVALDLVMPDFLALPQVAFITFKAEFACR